MPKINKEKSAQKALIALINVDKKMTETKTERVPIMFDAGLLKKIDDYSFRNRIRTRAETVRQLIVKGMETEETTKADAMAS